MKIKLEQSGGFAGISSTKEQDTNKLPTSAQKIVRELLDGKELSLSKSSTRPKGAADHYTYRITIHDGKRSRVIECNELDMDIGVKSLVDYIRQNPKK